MAEPEDDGSPGVPEWVVTYGDMMSLLLTFFIMLVSMSQLKEPGTVQERLDSIREVFGASQTLPGVPGSSMQTTSSYNRRSSQGMRSERGTKKASRKNQGRLGAHQTVRRINHGTILTLGGPSLFERFDATLNEAMKKNLNVLVQVIKTKKNRVAIRGHASPEPLPPNSPYRDRMDISFARAHAVAEYLIKKGIDRERLLVSAVGDAEPRMLTRHKETQKWNRRVDVFLLDSYITHPRNSDSPER